MEEPEHGESDDFAPVAYMSEPLNIPPDWFVEPPDAPVRESPGGRSSRRTAGRRQ